MTGFRREKTGIIIASLILFCLLGCTGDALSDESFPSTVRIIAPKDPVQILRRPNPTAEIITIALDGQLLEVLGIEGDYLKVRLDDSPEPGYLMKKYASAYTAPKKETSYWWLAALGVIVAIAGGAGGFAFWSMKKAREAERRAAAIKESIRYGEELFRSGEYDAAIREFRRHIDLQDGEIRNPDVYRRLAECCRQTERLEEAAAAWEKMRALGGLKKTEDHTLGVDIMVAQGKHAEAAQIYEQLLQSESDSEKIYDIRKKLFAAYRRLRDHKKLVRHADELLRGEIPDSEVLRTTVSYLVEEGCTDLAVEIGNKDIIKAVCSEFLEEQKITGPAERVYVKCLEYNRTDVRLHSMLAKKYQQDGDFVKAVTELTMLGQLDKGQAAVYTEQAAKLYMENGRVADALMGGNPQIVKKIAQLYLARSEVHPDAVAAYEKVLEFQPNAVGVNKILATVYLTKGDLHKYMEKLRLLHEIDGKTHDYLLDLAICMVDNELVAQALGERNRDLTKRLWKLMLKRAAHDDQAIMVYEAVLAEEPDNPSVKRVLAEAYDRRKEPEKAARIRSANMPGLRNAEAAQPRTGPSKPKTVEIGPPKTGTTTIRTKSDLAKKSQTVAPPKGVTKASGQPVAASGSPGASPKPPVKAPKTGVTGQITARPTLPAPAPASPPPISRPNGRPKPSVTAPATPPPVAQTDPSKQPTRPVSAAVPRTETGRRPAQPTAVNEQQVMVTEMLESPRKEAVTTFVSAYSDDTIRVNVAEKEVFRPATGSVGFAFHPVEALWEDGWGTWHSAKEVNTKRFVLLRVFQRGLVEAELRKRFLSDITELGFMLRHESILEQEDVVVRPDRTIGIIHPHYTRNLAKLLESKTPPDYDQSMRILTSVVRALTYAANYKGRDGQVRRTFHMHLQPMQVLFGDDLGTIKIAGLGYAHIYRTLTQGRRARWEDPGMNPAYMPPELFLRRAAAVRERSVDVYALGILMYRMLTGELPFKGPEFDDYKFEHARITAKAPSRLNADIPAWLNEVILRSLDKDPDSRWSSVAEVDREFASHAATG
ncbi:MAG: tetratricopeptide repeat protein [Pseudomonadota bacterium]